MRVKKVISAELFNYKDKRIAMTASVGACFIDFQTFSGDITLPQLIEWADQALYEAKSAGRNRVVLTNCQPPETRSETFY